MVTRMCMKIAATDSYQMVEGGRIEAIKTPPAGNRGLTQPTDVAVRGLIMHDCTTRDASQEPVYTSPLNRAIWNLGLPSSEKLILLALSWQSNLTIDFLADQTGISSRNLSRLLASLIEKKFVVRKGLSALQGESLCRSKTPQNMTAANRSCEWCKCRTLVLHEHHHPIPRSQGGTETVLICPNCHYEFHELTRGFYAINEDQTLAAGGRI